MTFGSARALSTNLTVLKSYNVLIFDLSDVNLIDTSLCLAFEDLILQLKNYGIVVYISGMSETVSKDFERIGLFDVLPSRQLTKSLLEALNEAVTDVNGRNYPQDNY